MTPHALAALAFLLGLSVGLLAALAALCLMDTPD